MLQACLAASMPLEQTRRCSYLGRRYTSMALYACTICDVHLHNLLCGSIAVVPSLFACTEAQLSQVVLIAQFVLQVNLSPYIDPRMDVVSERAFYASL